MKKTLKLTMALLAVCSTSSLALANKKIEQVFSYDMIGADITYIESIIGVARSTDTTFKTKTYLVDNCTLTVGYEGPNITTLEVTTGGKCNFILKDVISFEKNVPTNKVTFGLSGPVTYYSDCLTGCGNAYDPAIYELYTGSRAENWRELLISSINADYGNWRSVMEAKEGEEWVMEKHFNCQPDKYNDIAAKALKGQKAERIMIGFGLEEKAQLSFGCDQQNNFVNTTQIVASNNNGAFFKELPFQLIYQEDSYSHYVGSQIVTGELSYSFNHMDDRYLFSLKINEDNLHKIPNVVVKTRLQDFDLNGYTDMTQEKTTRAAEYFGIKTNLNDQKFIDKGCSVNGQATLHVTNLGFFIPPESSYETNIEVLRVIESGPFRVSCEEL